MDNTEPLQELPLGRYHSRLRSVTLADDLERKALALQGAAGMDISKGTAYLPFGIDYMEEQRRVVEEQQSVQKLQQEAMDEAQAQQGLQGSDSGGQPPGGEAGATPGDVYEQAKQVAQQLLYQTPESLRRGELLKIKQSNPTLHALVIQQMDEMRYEAQRQGGAQVMEQQKQQMQANGGGMVAQASADIDWIKAAADISDAILTSAHDKEYMAKLAAAIKQKQPMASEAFHYMYSKQRGWS